MSDKDKMKNNSNKDDVDQSNNLKNEETNEASEDQAELSLQEQLVKSQEETSKNWDKILPVSYTHLTLPTILLV